MPIIRIENHASTDLFGDQKEWRRKVRRDIWRAFKEAQVPGIEERKDVIIVFGQEWESDDDDEEAQNPRAAVIFIEAFEDRPDRPIELRKRLALLIGKALVRNLFVGWQVEVLPKHYSVDKEGAIVTEYEERPE